MNVMRNLKIMHYKNSATELTTGDVQNGKLVAVVARCQTRHCCDGDVTLLLLFVLVCIAKITTLNLCNVLRFFKKFFSKLVQYQSP